METWIRRDVTMTTKRAVVDHIDVGSADAFCIEVPGSTRRTIASLATATASVDTAEPFLPTDAAAFALGEHHEAFDVEFETLLTLGDAQNTEPRDRPPRQGCQRRLGRRCPPSRCFAARHAKLVESMDSTKQLAEQNETHRGRSRQRRSRPGQSRAYLTAKVMVIVMGRRFVVLGIVSVFALASTVSAGAGGSSATIEPRTGRSAAGPAATTGTVYSLALGDSTAMWNGDRSYPDLIVGHYKATVPHLTLVDMACSGETTSSMIAHSLCAPGGSQYNNALSFLHAHAGTIALVTIDIGGNDVVDCIYDANPTTCFANGLKTMQKNLAMILVGLRSVTHSQVRIIGMNYYDPLLGDWLAGPGPTRTLAINVMAGVATLNKDMTQVYAKVSVPVADVATAFQSSDMTQFVSSPWGRIPVAVDRACALLDIACHRNAPEAFGDDPNHGGAVVIAGAFEKTIGHLRAPNATTKHRPRAHVRV
jgi:hypothetical protein